MLTLKSGENDIQSWAFAVIPDKPPVIKFAGEPKRAVNGTLELNYEIVDDYGAASATTEFELAEQPAKDAHPLYTAPEMPLALPRRGARGNAAKTTRDLTEHVWAGAPVKITLHAVDAAGQEAKSETKTIILPERPFSNPLARAVLEQRRLLALDANSKRRVLGLIDAVTLRPEDTFDNMSHYLGIMSARTPPEDGRERRGAARRRLLSLGNRARHRGRRPLGRREAAAPGAAGAEGRARARRQRRGNRQAHEGAAPGDERVPARIRRARAEEPEPRRPDAARRGTAPDRSGQADGPDREPGEVGQQGSGAGAFVAARADDEQSAGRPPAAARRERPAERNAPEDEQARRDHAAPAGDDERDVPHGPDAAPPAPARPGWRAAVRRGRAGTAGRRARTGKA